MNDFGPRMRIIANADHEVRLQCAVCGAHRVVKRRMLAPVIICTTCDAARQLMDRRPRAEARCPDRRRILPAA